MKIIIDPYRGGNDTGKNISGQYEKNILLNISKYMNEEFLKKGIDSELVRNNDVSLTEDERNSIINEIKTDKDLIIQNRISEDEGFNIIYSLRNDDNLASTISKNLEQSGIAIGKYFQRRLPTNTMLDYYSIIRNTKPNETIIIEYNNPTNYQKSVNIIVDTIAKFLGKQNIYKVKAGDSLYQISKKYNVTVDAIKKLNNLSSNTLSIGQELKIPESTKESDKENTYKVKAGDSLYQISKKYNVTVEAIKKLNNLSSNTISIGQELKIPESTKESDKENTYKVKAGDSLYQISKKYNVTVDAIKKLNNLSSNTLSIGQELKIPESITETQKENTYKVKAGDSLYQISKKYNVTVDAIKKLNNLSNNTLSIGQELKIPR